MIVLAMSPPKLDSTTTTSASISTANAHTDLPHASEGPVTVRSWVAYNLPSSPRNPPMIPAVSLPPPDGSTATPVFTGDRKSTRLNSSHVAISYAVFCLKKKKIQNEQAESREEA